MAEFIEIIHNGNSISLQEFVDLNLIRLDNTQPAANNQLTLDGLFNYKGNNTRILNNYLPVDKSLYNNQPSKLLIRAGTLIRIPVDNIDKEIIAVETTATIPNNNYKAFLSDRIKKIISDSGYKPLNREDTESVNNRTYRIHSKFTVWIWCKALGESQLEGKIIDITPFVNLVSTTGGQDGGNFQIMISPVLGKYVYENLEIKDELVSLAGEMPSEFIQRGSWQINKGSAVEYLYNGESNFVLRESTIKTSNNKAYKNNVLFHNIIQSNDVVFIQFEELEIEKDTRRKHIGELSLENLIISDDKLSGKYFDMIGLVDVNSLSDNSSTADLSVTVTGRDLMKLLIEDGEYFFTADFSNGDTAAVQADGISSGNNDVNKPMRRLIDGNLNFFNAYVDRTVEYSLKFIMNMLSNVQICSDTLFKSHEDKVKRYEYDIVNDKATNLQKVDVAGIWQIINLIVDSEISNRRIVDSSIVSDQGSLLNFIKNKVIHAPFSEFFGDTYGDKYYLIARKPPYSKESYNDNKKYAINIEPSVVSTATLSFDDSEVFSWYRITPKGNFYGDDQDIALTYFPAKFFESYAKVWGSKPLIQVSNYIDYQGIKDVSGTINLKSLIDQATQDLAYMIETNSYRPFTRKGTITLALGDRRIKRGQCIRLTGTGEIYHVDSVTQTATINSGVVDRFTVLTVSRGMIEKHMDGTKFNYFNIIDLDRDLSGKSISSNFKVNEDVFQFFMKREQFN